ncbi:MAG: TraR/DksA C4-type zinc finger protein [Bacillota bacterium]|jgi:YteA family regulatory protein
MDTAKLNEFKKRLLAEKERLETDLKANDRYNLENSMTGVLQELSAYDNHPADVGSELFEREKDLALWNNSREILQRINEALDHMDKGIYGICEDCGREISPERLEALPHTTLCLECQHREEDHHQTRERPIEEEVLGPPFGRTFLDDADLTGFDGEDAWQAVARYGTSESPSDLGGVDSYDDLFNDADNETQGVVELTDEIAPSEDGARSEMEG